MTKEAFLQLSDAERATLRTIAERHGITEEEAATRLVQGELAKRVRRHTRKGPAKVYRMKGKGKA